jgi:hypothetical protein
MKSKNNIFKFSSEFNEVIPDIKPAKNYIPDWYKSIKGYNNNNIEFNSENIPSKNVKSCMPFLDSLTSGYMLELWCDIHVKINDEDGRHYITWGKADPQPAEFRENSRNPIPVPIGCEPSHYIWMVPYSIKTPKGYSFIATHPINRFDLPFISLTGIVDAEKTIGPGNYPFFLKKDFEGVIEKGTPILQIIPFKKEDWTLDKDFSIVKEGLDNSNKSTNVFFGFYKKEMWNRKKYD